MMKRVMVQRENVAHRALLAAEMVLPEAVAQNGHAGAASLIVGSVKQPAHGRTHAKRAEIATARIEPIGVSHGAALCEIKVFLPPARRKHPGKNVLPVAQLLPKRVRESRVVISPEWIVPLH